MTEDKRPVKTIHLLLAILVSLITILAFFGIEKWTDISNNSDLPSDENRDTLVIEEVSEPESTKPISVNKDPEVENIISQIPETKLKSNSPDSIAIGANTSLEDVPVGANRDSVIFEENPVFLLVRLVHDMDMQGGQIYVDGQLRNAAQSGTLNFSFVEVEKRASSYSFLLKKGKKECKGAGKITINNQAINLSQCY